MLFGSFFLFQTIAFNVVRLYICTRSRAVFILGNSSNESKHRDTLGFPMAGYNLRVAVVAQ